MRHEIWIRLSPPTEGGQAEIDRRLKQLAKLLERLALELIEVRQVTLKPATDD